jgi:hypothetical protein
MTAELDTIGTPPEPAEVASKVSHWAERAREVVIVDQASFDAAAELLLGIKALEREVRAVFDPMAEAAHAAHKKITTERAAQLEPLAAAEAIIKHKASAFLLEQKRKARAEQECLNKLAAEEAARQLEAQIEQAEANGASPAELEAIIDDAPPAPVVYVAPSVETKGTGISQRREWVAEVDGERGLTLLIQAAAKTPQLRGLLKVDEVKLRQMTKAMGSEMKRIPGLKVYERAVIAAGRK